MAIVAAVPPSSPRIRLTMPSTWAAKPKMIPERIASTVPLPIAARGGPAGFCRVLGDGRLAIPDVKGNRRLDSLRNIVANPHAGLLFMVPGMRETLRVNGAAELTTRPDVIEFVSDPGKPAILAVVVRPDEVFLHCAKALIRSSLWDTATWPPADELPSAARILRDHVGDDATVAQVQAALDESIATRLY